MGVDNSTRPVYACYVRWNGEATPAGFPFSWTTQVSRARSVTLDGLAGRDTSHRPGLHWFAEAASQHMVSKDRDFGAEVIRKRIKLGLQAS